MNDPRIAVENFGKSRLAAEILKAIDDGATIWLTEKGREICKIVPLAKWEGSDSFWKRVQDVACPYCSAAAGEPCRRPAASKHLKGPHNARIDAFRADNEYSVNLESDSE